MQYIVHKRVALSGPTIETAESWICYGVRRLADVALPDCVRTVIGWLNGHGGISRRDAYALCSMAVSFRVTQWANQTGSVPPSIPPRTIHAVIPKSVLGGGLLADRIDASMPTGVMSLTAAESLKIMQLVCRSAPTTAPPHAMHRATPSCSLTRA